MKPILISDNIHIVRFDIGEDIFTLLIDYCSKNKIAACTFNAIGAAAEITLSYYDLPNKQYLDYDYTDLEIVSVNGNLSEKESEKIVHAHGVFSNRDMQTVGGHIKKIIVSATCEVILLPLKEPLTRNHDEKTGLNLLS